MPVPIVIGGSSPIYNFNPVSTVDWSIIPPKMFFFWEHGQTLPLPFIQNLRFPAYNLLPAYEDYTDWQFETQVVFEGAIPFCLVEGFINSTGDLGTLDVDFYEKQLELSFQNLDLMTGGKFYVYFNCKVTAIQPGTLLRKTIAENKTELYLYIRTGIPSFPSFKTTFVGDAINPLTLVRNKMVFNYRLGGFLPAPQTVFCFPGLVDLLCESVDLILNYSVTNTNMGELSVGFPDVSGLSIGQYASVITLSKGATTEIINVVLNVLTAKPEGLSIDPEEIIFDVTSGAEPPAYQSVNISSDANWSIISAVPDWLFISQFSGFGNEDVLFSPKDYEALEDGEYTTDVVFLSEGVEVILSITMNLFTAVRNPFYENRFYFTKDEDYLYFKSKNSDTYFEITLQLRVFKINTNEFRDYERIYKLPMFQGRANFHVGTTVHQLLNEMQSLIEQVPSVEMNYTKSQYQPAQVLVQYEEVSYFPETPIEYELTIGQTSLFQMIKGTSPYITNSKLGLLTVAQQELTRLTPNSILGISFTFPGTPYLIVKRNTVVIDELFLTPFSPAESEKVIYSYYRFLNDFDPGDVIEISLINDLETRTQRFLVMDAGPESTFVLFENQNGLVEPFEFSGRRRVSSNIEHLLAEKLVKLNATTKKIEAFNSQGLIVNTGQLSKPDHKIITAIVKSENVWVSFDSPFGPYLKVDATTSKFINQDTASNEDDFDIEFNILEDTDATIYPQ